MFKIEIDPITNELYKDNYSDIIVILTGNKYKKHIFNNLVGIKKHNIIWKDKFYKFSKYNYNDENYIVLNLENELEFIVFYNPLITIFITDFKNIYEDLKKIYQYLEISNNLILCITNNIDVEPLKNILKLPIIITNNDSNYKNKLKNEIWKASYEKYFNNNFIYSEKIEKSIKNISNYLSNNIKFKNIRYLSISLLLNKKDVKELIKKYLYYDVDDDNTLINLIKKEQDKYENLEMEMNKELDTSIKKAKEIIINLCYNN